MKAKSYDDWALIGFQVIRGEKSTGRDPKTGKATFTREQVESDEERSMDDFEDVSGDYR